MVLAGRKTRELRKFRSLAVTSKTRVLTDPQTLAKPLPLTRSNGSVNWVKATSGPAEMQQAKADRAAETKAKTKAKTPETTFVKPERQHPSRASDNLSGRAASTEKKGTKSAVSAFALSVLITILTVAERILFLSPQRALCNHLQHFSVVHGAARSCNAMQLSHFLPQTLFIARACRTKNKTPLLPWRRRFQTFMLPSCCSRSSWAGCHANKCDAPGAMHCTTQPPPDFTIP